MKLVKPGDVENTEVKPVKNYQMNMQIPVSEQPVMAVTLVLGKSGEVYVGHMAGQEAMAHQLCLRGADVLFGRLHQALVESATTRVQPVRSLADVGLPSAPPRERN